MTLPTDDPKYRDAAFSIVLAHAAAASMFLDTKRAPKLSWLEGFWSIAVFVALPLVAVLVLDGRRNVAARALAAAGAVAALTPVALRASMGGGKSWALDHPELLIAPSLVAAACVVLGALVARIDWDAWGLGLGDWRWWGPKVALLVFAGVIPLVVAGAAVSPELRDFYPADPQARTDFGWLLVRQGGRGMYMFGWELFWRGVLLFGFARVHGPLVSIVIQSFPFFLMHKPKPELEMLSSMPGGMLLAAFCWRAKSFWPAFLLHWSLNLTMDVVGYLV